MRQIGLAVVLALSLLIAPLAAGAQQQVGKTYRIGFLRYLGCAEQGHFTELRQGLRDLGYAERHNLVIECRAAPAISRVTVLIDSSNPGQTLPDQQMAAAAEVLGVRPQRADIVASADLDKAFATVLRQQAQALLVYPLPIAPFEFQRITEFAI